MGCLNRFCNGAVDLAKLYDHDIVLLELNLPFCKRAC